ncbi:MAG: hypothetical protein RL026_804 [Pseudomonadota bacterium]|jgi:hypothetical protein
MHTVPLGPGPTLFVINLAASATPVTLSQPQDPALRRYTFFVSRRREDGRERFRLHMGYFHDPAHAEDLLPTIRDIYPTAWVGPAPVGGRAPRPGARGEDPGALLDELRDLKDLLARLGDPTEGLPESPAEPARTLGEREVLRLLDDTAPTLPAPLPLPLPQTRELPESGVADLALTRMPPSGPRHIARRAHAGAPQLDPGRVAPQGRLLQTLGAGDLSLDDSRDPRGLAGLQPRRPEAGPEAGDPADTTTPAARFGRLLGALSARLGTRRSA